MLKSRDGGATWTASSFPGVPVFDPTTPTTLYAFSNTGTFKSTDGGAAWRGLIDTFVTALAIDPTMPSTLYAGTYSGGVFKSTDGGSTWSTANFGLRSAYVWALAIDPTTPGRLYASGEGVFTSTDGAMTWQLTGLGSEVICGDGFTACGEQCDDGNHANGDSREADCKLPRCGNSILDSGEECDDGNQDPADGCTNACTICGNNLVTPPEACDDGNLVDSDACTADCRLLPVVEVGTGTPASCTEAALDAGLVAGSRTVRFNCGTDPVTITITTTKTIAQDTRIDGGGVITISGGNTVRIFDVGRGIRFDVLNLTIANGRAAADEAGGGILNAGTTTLANCTLRDNSAYAGGAIASSGTLRLAGCTLSGNSGGINDGGIYSWTEAESPLARMTLVNCTLAGNSASIGGGILGVDSVATLTNCTLNANSGGGGLAFVGGDLALANSVIANSTPKNCAIAGDPITDGGHNLQWPGTDCGSTIPSLDPSLDPSGLQDNGGPTQTIALLRDSPAIDAGDPECARACR